MIGGKSNYQLSCMKKKDFSENMTEYNFYQIRKYFFVFLIIYRIYRYYTTK